MAADLDDAAALSALDELLAAGMVRPGADPERYEFGHALVRHAVYDSLNPSRQARLHRRLAHGLEAARARFPDVRIRRRSSPSTRAARPCRARRPGLRRRSRRLTWRKQRARTRRPWPF